MQQSDATVVTTTGGTVRGREHEHGTVFLSVPYAAPPIGENRFTAPRPHPGWAGIRDATRPGPTAPQPLREKFGTLDMTPFFGPGWIPGDDYLTVNVWAPRHSGRAHPVMVFVHGGGSIAGSSHGPLYDGSAFQRDGVVLVTVNHRLGVPGFLHLPDAPDNRGMLDVRAALRWVRDNIGEFGGDRANVTLFGQSAGATLVGGLLADVASTGLFRRVIVQSGAQAFTPEQAGVVTEAVGRELGLVPSAKALADVPDEHFVAVLPHLNGLDLRTATAHDPLGGITRFGLVSEEQPAAVIARGAGAEADLLIGSNLDEGRLYLAPLGLLKDSTLDDVREAAERFSSRPDAFVDDLLRKHSAVGLDELRAIVLTHGLFGAATEALAAAHAASSSRRTFRYQFAWQSAALGGRLGASHVMELPFVFETLSLPALYGDNGLLGDVEPPTQLAAEVHRTWVRFARTGSPDWPGHRERGYVEPLGLGSAAR
ncbi:carboxylesterase/lipase family protein [Lentzea sp. NPDC058450]|uniref:carboxylesterase/lipase family protein n=1 Tax=Lentzea sp. NPDC058450 TaxID=3346505 RepID=UPI00364F5988